MHNRELLYLTLGILEPWAVKDFQLDNEDKILTLHIHFTKGSRFTGLKCGKPSIAGKEEDNVNE